MSEQEIISKYFSRHQPNHCIDIGIGDDAAVVIPPHNSRLVITTDTLNEGVHFFSDCLPEHIGHKSLAVNLSDLAAMGAKPLWATINLSLPKIDHPWISAFSKGLFCLADEHNIKIIGGDLVKGPLSISMQAIGYVTSEKVLTRSNAMIDDHIFVSGFVGDAALGLKIRKEKIKLDKNKLDDINNSLNKPIPRISLGLEILNFASAAIDVSDGLLQDMQLITAMSKVGAKIEFEKVPFSPTMQSYLENTQDWMLPIIGGDDYELIFTADKKYTENIEQIGRSIDCRITEIGKIVKGEAIHVYKNSTKMELPEFLGFDHFQ